MYTSNDLELTFIAFIKVVKKISLLVHNFTKDYHSQKQRVEISGYIYIINFLVSMSVCLSVCLSVCPHPSTIVLLCPFVPPCSERAKRASHSKRSERTCEFSINIQLDVSFEEINTWNSIVKISRKYLPQTCSRSERVWWLRSIFSISLPWQKRWRYRHLQDRNRSRVWLNFINNRSRLPLQWLYMVPPNYLSKKSTLGLSTRITNKQRCMFGNNYILNLCTQWRKQCMAWGLAISMKQHLS